MRTGLVYTTFIISLVVNSTPSFSKQNPPSKVETPKVVTQAAKKKPKISFEQGMNEAADIYILMQAELAGNGFKSFAKLASQIQDLAERFDMSEVKGEHAKHYAGIPEKMISESKKLEKAKTISNARDSFKLLSQAFVMWISMDKPKHLQVVYCPMAEASWIQKAGTEVSNPYLTNMPKCGSIVGNEKEKKKHHH